jgi:hypothetical protein
LDVFDAIAWTPVHPAAPDRPLGAITETLGGADPPDAASP